MRQQQDKNMKKITSVFTHVMRHACLIILLDGLFFRERGVLPPPTKFGDIYPTGHIFKDNIISVRASPTARALVLPVN